jgi:hypothetical protein
MKGSAPGEAWARRKDDINKPETLHRNPAGGKQTPPGKAGHSRNRVLRGEGKPTLRSVDRECMGCVTEPRKIQCGCRLCSLGGRQHLKGKWPAQKGPPGSASGARAQGSHRNLGDPIVSAMNSGWGSHDPKNPGPEKGCRHLRETRTTEHKVVPRNEGDEVKRDERQGVGATLTS